MFDFHENPLFAKIAIWIQECLLLVFSFLYLFFQIHPRLILELQPSAILMDFNFFNEFLKIPGGLTDWLSSFIMQFWSSDLSIAFFLSACFWFTAFLTKKWMETLTENRLIHTFHLIPAVLLIFLHSQYDFHLSITLALMINLSCLNLIIRWTPNQQAGKIVVGLSVSVLLFWITGGAFLIYAVLFGFGEYIFHRQIRNGSFFIIFSFLLPYAASATIFLVTIRQAYLHNLISETPTKFWYVGYTIPAFYLLVLVISSAAPISILRKPFTKFSEFVRLKKLTFSRRSIIGVSILLGGAYILTNNAHDDNVHLILEINQSARESRWKNVLETATHCSIVNPLISSQTNLALFQSNMLLERMFAFPQFYRTFGLFMDFDWCSAWPEKASTLYWKLGLINESLHWAHEAFELKGPTPEILERLGMIYMVKGDKSAAKRFFLNLKNIPFHEKTANDLLQINESPLLLSQDSSISFIQACMPNEDMVTLGKSIPDKLELLLKRNPKNRMAFEYLIAFYLMDGNLQGLIDHFSNGSTFSYSHIPRHMQEALLVIASINPNVDQNQLKNLIQPITFQRFASYQQILHTHQESISSARSQLQKQFGDTYWYYLMYIKPEVRSSENQNDFQ
jgi:hypothetical protein